MGSGWIRLRCERVGTDVRGLGWMDGWGWDGWMRLWDGRRLKVPSVSHLLYFEVALESSNLRI